MRAVKNIVLIGMMGSGKTTCGRLLAQRLELHSHRPRRGLYYERNVHFLLDFLLDLDQVELTVESGVVYYRRKDSGPVHLV